MNRKDQPAGRNRRGKSWKIQLTISDKAEHGQVSPNDSLGSLSEQERSDVRAHELAMILGQIALRKQQKLPKHTPSNKEEP